MPFGRPPALRPGNDEILLGHKIATRDNWTPLFSLSPVLTEAQLSRAGLSNFLPGKPRAIRVPQDVAGRLADLIGTPPDSQAGLDPITEPTEEELTAIEQFPAVQAEPFENVRVIRRTPVNFHFTGNIGGGPAASELRVYGAIPNPFDIRSIEIVAASGIAPGQFIDILIANDNEAADTATPTGTSIFPLLTEFSSLPAADQQRGMVVPNDIYDLPINHRTRNTQQSIKVRLFFVAPAIALPNLSVVIVIDELVGIETTTTQVFAPEPESVLAPPASATPSPPAPTEDKRFLLQTGTPMSGYGTYSSLDEAIKAAQRATTGARGKLVKVWGEQTGTVFFERGQRLF